MEASLPLVTIGASNYNNAKYVIETLESIRNQTYPNIELIVTDDCSTDNSPELIREWLKTYHKPFRFIENKVNTGLPAVLNKLVSNAAGKYISEVATDDVLMSDKIKVQVEMLEKAASDVCCVYSDSYIIDEDSKLTGARFIKRNKGQSAPTGNVYEMLLSGTMWFHYSAAMVRTESYKKVGLFDVNLIGEDTDMLLRLSREFGFLYSDYVSEKYRVRSNSLTNTTNWYPSQLEIFSKNIKYSKTAIKRMDAAATSAYFNNDSETIALLPKYRSKSSYILCLIQLNKMHFPKGLARIILFSLRAYLNLVR